MILSCYVSVDKIYDDDDADVSYMDSYDMKCQYQKNQQKLVLIANVG